MALFFNPTAKEQLAAQGNVQAMLDLADYYYKQFDKSKGEQALNALESHIYWLEKAATSGSTAGIMQAISGNNLLAVVKETIEDWNGAYLARVNQNKWAATALQYLNLNRKERQMVEAELDTSRYEQAYALSEMKESGRALSVLQGWNSTKALVLQGVCMYDIGINTNNNDRMIDAYNLLSIIEQDPKYAKIEKTEHEEMAYATGAWHLSSFYRIGLPSLVTPDLKRAATMLTNVFNSLRRDDIKRFLYTELGRYKKKTFGGYKYE